MARLAFVGLDARSRLHEKTTPWKDEYRSALMQLNESQMLEVSPDEGESMRTLKMRVSSTSREMGREMKYGETEDGKLLVWVHPSTSVSRRKRRTVS